MATRTPISQHIYLHTDGTAPAVSSASGLVYVNAPDGKSAIGLSGTAKAYGDVLSKSHVEDLARSSKLTVNTGDTRAAVSIALSGGLAYSAIAQAPLHLPGLDGRSVFTPQGATVWSDQVPKEAFLQLVQRGVLV